MATLITITGLSRKLDRAVQTVRARVESGVIIPIAKTQTGQPLFDANRLDEYRQHFKPFSACAESAKSRGVLSAHSAPHGPR